jgi:hypothetical protein
MVRFKFTARTLTLAGIGLALVSVSMSELMALTLNGGNTTEALGGHLMRYESQAVLGVMVLTTGLLLRGLGLLFQSPEK